MAGGDGDLKFDEVEDVAAFWRERKADMANWEIVGFSLTRRSARGLSP